MSEERERCINGELGCRQGRIFGGWAKCIHGAKGRLAEVEAEREHLLAEIAEYESKSK